jgi:hypothetical protein
MRNVLRPYRRTDAPPSVVFPPPATRADSRASRVAHAYERAGVRERERIVTGLVESVGSLALAVLGGGAFAGRLTRSRQVAANHDGARLRAAQVHELARYVEQSDPQRFAAIVDEVSRAEAERPAPDSAA